VKNKMKKAQAAMEFLMTYGWAILVALVVIGAIAYFGVLNQAKFLPGKCSISDGFSCAEYKLDSGEVSGTKQVKIYLQNNMGVDADVVLVEIEDEEGVSCTSSDNSNDLTSGGMANGVKSGAIVFDGGCIPASSSFTGKIIVTYEKVEGDEFHTATGTISGRFED
jgi:hypothetical protein